MREEVMVGAIIPFKALSEEREAAKSELDTLEDSARDTIREARKIMRDLNGELNSTISEEARTNLEAIRARVEAILSVSACIHKESIERRFNRGSTE
jgi:signal transduction histidine kinase